LRRRSTIAAEIWRLTEWGPFPTIPPRVDYELTDLGRGLWKPVEALGTWAGEHLTEIEDARARFDRRNDAADLPDDRMTG
jgi:DNA-binding HxlR family transcriptional regulator